MVEILTQSGCLVAIVALGFVLRRVGFFKEEDFKFLSRVIVRVVMPATIIVSFAGKEIDLSMLTLSLLGLLSGLLYMAVGCLINIRKSRERAAFGIVNLSSYNIGNFALPFIQSFLGSTGAVTMSIFDTGNAVICLGGSFSVAAMIKDGQKFSPRRLISTLFHSIPFVCYMIVLAMNLLHIPMPGPILSFAGIISRSNAFLAMLMIGIGFRLECSRSQIGEILRYLLLRYGIAAVLSLAYYYLLPFPLEVRQTLVMLALCPIGTAMPAFTAELQGDTGLASQLNSFSILCSVVIYVAVLPVLLG